MIDAMQVAQKNPSVLTIELMFYRIFANYVLQKSIYYGKSLFLQTKFCRY